MRTHALLAALALVGCVKTKPPDEPQKPIATSCDPTQPTTVARPCGLDRVPSAFFSASDQTLWIGAWDRQPEVLAGLRARVLSPSEVLFKIDDKEIKAKLGRLKWGPTETDEGFIVPGIPLKKWVPGVPPIWGDVLIELDHECTLGELEMDCLGPSQYQLVNGGPWLQGFLKWANGRKSKTFGYCTPKPQKVCAAVWTDMGTVDAYADAQCTVKQPPSFQNPGWICLAG